MFEILGLILIAFGIGGFLEERDKEKQRKIEDLEDENYNLRYH